MPLEPRTQEIPLAAGIDTADDPQGAPQGFLTVENIVWDKDRVMSKRRGFEFLEGTTNPLQNNMALVSAGPTLGIVRQDITVPYIGPATEDFPIPATPAGSVAHESIGTYFAGTRVAGTDTARAVTLDGRAFLCIAVTRITEESGSTPFPSPVLRGYIQIVDEASGAVVAEEQLVSNSYGLRVIVQYDGSGNPYFCVGYVQHVLEVVAMAQVTLPDCVVSQISLTAVGAVHVETTLTYPCFDMVDTDGTSFYLLFSAKTTNFLSERVCNYAGATGSVITTAAVCRYALAGTYLFTPGVIDLVVYYIDPTALMARIYHAVIGVTTAIRDVMAVASASQTNGLGLVHRGSRVFSLTRSYLSTVQSVFVDEYDAPSFTVANIGSFKNSILSSGPWAVDAASVHGVYVLLSPYNALTTELYTTLVAQVPRAGEDFVVVGQLAFDETGVIQDVFNIQGLPHVVSDVADADTFYAASLATLESGVADSNGPVNRVRLSRLSFGLDRPITTASLNGVGYISGSALESFDGTYTSSATFLAAPSAPVLTQPNAGALTGTYNYRVVYELTDVHGQMRVSVPSPAVEIVVTSKKITVTHLVVPHLVARYDVAQRNIRVKIYRTTAGDTVFYLAHVFTARYGDTVTVDDNLTDIQVAAKERIYTTGLVLESEPAPPLTDVITHRNRLFGLRSDTPEIVAYTKEAFDPFYPEWNSTLTFRLDHEGGPPTALASLGDKLVVFQKDSAAIVVGQGPDNLGNGAFSLPEVVVRGVGVAAADVATVAVIPPGIVFKHSTGFQLLTPDLQITPFGRQIEDAYVGFRIFRARYLPSLHQLWILCQPIEGEVPEGTPQRVLVFDVRYGRWSILTSELEQFVDVLEHRGAVYLLTRTNLYTYRTDGYADVGPSATFDYPMAWETPWFRADRAQAVRLWKIHLSGTVVDFEDATVAVQVFTQQSQVASKDADTADTTYTWDPAALADLPAGPATLTARVVTQRCQAFKCRVEVSGDGNPSGIFRPATVTYDFGVLPSRGKVPLARKPTAS